MRVLSRSVNCFFALAGALPETPFRRLAAGVPSPKTAYFKMRWPRVTGPL
jgi:hypothetical protein